MGLARLYRDITLNGVCKSALLPRKVRWRALAWFGLDIGGACTISPACWFGGTNVAIGAGSTVNYGVFFDNSARIELGSMVDVGMEVMFCTGTHEFGTPKRRAGRAHGSAITVGDGTWIGARAIILPGVTIGPGCVIAAGSVVVADCPPNGLYAGVPARLVRQLNP